MDCIWEAVGSRLEGIVGWCICFPAGDMCRAGVVVEMALSLMWVLSTLKCAAK